MQRKAEVDLDLRKKAEAERGEIRKRLEDETNKRTREQGCYSIETFCLDF